MLDLIILVLISLVVSYFVADKKLEDYFLNLDYIYFEFLEEENLKIKKQEEIKINIKNMIRIEQKIKNNNKVIKLYKKHTKPVYIKDGCYVTAYQDKPSYVDVWKAEGLNIKYKKQWQEKYNHNKKLNNQK